MFMSRKVLTINNATFVPPFLPILNDIHGNACDYLSFCCHSHMSDPLLQSCKYLKECNSKCSLAGYYYNMGIACSGQNHM